MTRSVRPSVLVALAALLVTPSLLARDRAAPERDLERGYTYSFDDDPLAAKGLDATGAGIVVRPRGARSMLTRPRTSFVHRLLASVEAL